MIDSTPFGHKAHRPAMRSTPPVRDFAQNTQGMSQNRKDNEINAFSARMQIGAPVTRKIYLRNQAGTRLWGSLVSEQPNKQPLPEREGEPYEKSGHFPGARTGVPMLAVRYNR